MNPTALVLAGERSEGCALSKSENVSHKSLIELDGQTMLMRVVAALQDSDVGAIVVATNDDQVALLASELGYQIIPADSSPALTVLDALDRFGTPLIVTTSDHGFLEGSWVNSIIEETCDTQDIGIMLARRELIEAAAPETQRTYLRFADADWSGCNLFFLKTDAARSAIELWKDVEKDRKQPWKLAARIGFGTLFALLTKRLAVADGVGRLGAKIGIKAAVVPAQSGLAAIDADKPQDLIEMRKIVSQGLGSTAAD